MGFQFCYEFYAIWIVLALLVLNFKIGLSKTSCILLQTSNQSFFFPGRLFVRASLSVYLEQINLSCGISYSGYGWGLFSCHMGLLVLFNFICLHPSRLYDPSLFAIWMMICLMGFRNTSVKLVAVLGRSRVKLCP